MTADQIIGVFQSEPQKARKLESRADARTFGDGVATVGINGISIDSRTFDVYFLFDENTKGLKAVRLRPSERDPSTAVFEYLENLLTQKYGPPGKRDIRSINEITLSAQWSFPSTQIELKMFDSRALSTRLLTLTYKERKEQDKL